MNLATTNDSPKVLHPYCNVCGWRKGGVDSWNGFACKCGFSDPVIKHLDAAHITTSAGE